MRPFSTFRFVGLLIEPIMMCQIGMKHTKATAMSISTSNRRNIKREGDSLIAFLFDLISAPPQNMDVSVVFLRIALLPISMIDPMIELNKPTAVDKP